MELTLTTMVLGDALKKYPSLHTMTLREEHGSSVMHSYLQDKHFHRKWQVTIAMESGTDIPIGWVWVCVVPFHSYQRAPDRDAMFFVRANYRGFGVATQLSKEIDRLYPNENFRVTGWNPISTSFFRSWQKRNLKVEINRW